jgi:integrase
MRLIRPGVWEVRVFLGRTAEGRVRHLQRTFPGTKRAAERELARLIADQDREPVAAPDQPVVWGPTTTINDAIAAWQLNGWEDLSPKTVLRYESVWNVHIRKSIGRRRIATLSPYDLERYFRGLKQAGLSEGSVRMVRAVIHRACRLARRWSGNVLPNPVGDTELPVWKLDERPEKVRAPEVGEVLALLAAARRSDLRFAVFLLTLAATGVRRGEACALRWSDLDWEAGTLRVDEAVVAARGGAVVRGPKTRASVRTVAVDDGTMKEIALLRDRQRDLAAACGVPVRSDAFVFSFEPGGQLPPYPDSFSHALARVRAEAGVSADLHLHSLRHFHATALDAVISEAQKQARLGWSTVQMARHYTDTVVDEDRRAADYVGALLAAGR